MRNTLLSLLAALALTACGPLIEVDRVDVEQGNRLEPDEIRALRVGMTRTEVRELLGTPVIASPFHASRWDYVYYQTEAGTEPEQEPRRLTIHFEDDRVARIEDRFATPAAGNGGD